MQKPPCRTTLLLRNKSQRAASAPTSLLPCRHSGSLPSDYRFGRSRSRRSSQTIGSGCEPKCRAFVIAALVDLAPAAYRSRRGSTRVRLPIQLCDEQPRGLRFCFPARGESRVSADLDQETSRGALAGPAIRRAARRRAYTPPTESGSSASTLRSADGSTTRRCARLATSRFERLLRAMSCFQRPGSPALWLEQEISGDRRAVGPCVRSAPEGVIPALGRRLKARFSRGGLALAEP